MSMMNTEQMNQHQLLEWIQMLTLCSYDMQLYLDTHPCDQDALDYFNQCAELLKNATCTYESNYGPFQVNQAAPFEKWTWVETPMPWEGGTCACGSMKRD